MDNTERENVKKVFCGSYKTDLENDGRIIGCDSGFLEMTGYLRSQLESGEVTFYTLVPPEIKDEYLEAAEKLTANGGGTLEHNIVTADGGRLGVICIGRNYTSEEGHLCADIILSDISTYRAITK